MKREGFAIGRIGNAAMPTGSTLGQSDMMRQARKLLITAPIGFLTLVSRPSNAITLRVSSAELRLGDRRRSGSAAVQCRLFQQHSETRPAASGHSAKPLPGWPECAHVGGSAEVGRFSKADIIVGGVVSTVISDVGILGTRTTRVPAKAAPASRTER